MNEKRPKINVDILVMKDKKIFLGLLKKNGIIKGNKFMVFLVVIYDLAKKLAIQ